METIDKQIKLRINAEIAKNRSNYALFNEGMKKGADIALSQIQRANRWIPVNERLPEVKEEEYYIVAKSECGAYDLYWVCQDFEISYYLEGYVEWKPIE